MYAVIAEVDGKWRIVAMNMHLEYAEKIAARVSAESGNVKIEKQPLDRSSQGWVK